MFLLKHLFKNQFLALLLYDIRKTNFSAKLVI